MVGEIVGGRGKVLTASRTRWLKVFSKAVWGEGASKIRMVFIISMW